MDRLEYLHTFPLTIEEIFSQGITSENEGKEIIEMLAELPDLWDVNISDWSMDSATSRFESEGDRKSVV